MPTYITDRVMQPWRTIIATTDGGHTVPKKVNVGEKINADTIIGDQLAFTITLPTGINLLQNDQIVIRDPNAGDKVIADVTYKGWTSVNLTISAAQPINGKSETLVCNIQGATVSLTYWDEATGWRVYAY